MTCFGGDRYDGEMDCSSRCDIARKAGKYLLAGLIAVAVLTVPTLGMVSHLIFRPKADATLPSRRVDTILSDGRALSVQAFTSETPLPADSLCILYIHGTPGTATSAWRAYLDEPVMDLPSMAADRPGFGLSTHDLPYVRFEDQARAMIALLEPGQRAIVVGHSWGGPIAAQLAADYPEHVAGLVIVAGSLDPSLEKLAWYNHVLNWPIVRMWFHSAVHNSNAEIFAGAEQLEMLARKLSAIDVPLTIIHGTSDRLVPYENVHYMERAFSGSSHIERITLEGAGHFIIWTHQPTIRTAIAEMTARISRD